MHDFLWIENYKLDRVCCYSKYLMKINVSFYIKNFFDNYREAKATYKEKTKDISKKKKKVTVTACLFYAVQHVISFFSAK